MINENFNEITHSQHHCCYILIKLRYRHFIYITHIRGHYRIYYYFLHALLWFVFKFYLFYPAERQLYHSFSSSSLHSRVRVQRRTLTKIIQQILCTMYHTDCLSCLPQPYLASLFLSKYIIGIIKFPVFPQSSEAPTPSHYLVYQLGGFS